MCDGGCGPGTKRTPEGGARRVRCGVGPPRSCGLAAMAPDDSGPVRTPKWGPGSLGGPPEAAGAERTPMGTPEEKGAGSRGGMKRTPLGVGCSVEGCWKGAERGAVWVVEGVEKLVTVREDSKWLLEYVKVVVVALTDVQPCPIA